MPKVGKKTFSYSKRGRAAARAHAKKTGKKVVRVTTSSKRSKY